MSDDQNDAFDRGYLVACSNLTAMGNGAVLAEHLVREHGQLKVEDLERLGLSEFDCENLAPIFAAIGGAA